MPDLAVDRVRLPIALLVSAFVARGVMLACVLPPGEMWDEYAHLAVVDYWAQAGRAAVYGRTTVDPAFLAAVARLPQPPPVAFARTYGPFWAGSRPATVPPALGMYEAQHPPLFYALAARIYSACGGRADLPTAVSALRLANLACGAAAVALVLRWLARNADPPSAVLLGCWVAFQPLLLLNAVRVANDGLAFLLGTAVVVTALDLHRTGLVRRTCLLAALLPLSILAKATNFTLVPVVAAAWVAAVGRGSVRPRAAAVSLAVIVAVTAAGLGPYVAGNLRTFGLVTPMQEAVANRAAGRSAWAVLTAASPRLWPTWAASWWVANGLWVGGWSFLRPPWAMVVAYAGLVGTAGVAAVVRWRSLPLPTASRWTMLALVACVHGGLMVHATESYAAWGGRVFTNPWYAAVAVPWWLVLLGCGGLSSPSPCVRRGVMLGVPSVFVTTEAVGLFSRMVPAYYASPASAVAWHRMAGLHPNVLGPPTLAVATLATVALVAVLGRRAARAAGASGPGAVAGR